MKVFTIAAQLEGYRSLKDRTLKLTFETNELSPDDMANIQGALMTVGYLAYSPDPFTTDEIKLLDGLKVEYSDTGKTPSQRFRAVLYRAWEQNPERYDVFNDFYNAKMEKLINHFKGKLV